MTPVISPWVFYALSVVDVMKIIVILAAVFVTSFAITMVCIAFVNRIEWGETDEDYLKFKSFAKPSVTLSVILVLLSVLIPSERTLTKMIVAQNVTHERVEVVTDTVETVYNDIMNLFKEVDVND